MHRNMGAVVIFERDWETKEGNETYLYSFIQQLFVKHLQCARNREDGSVKETHKILPSWSLRSHRRDNKISNLDGDR